MNRAAVIEHLKQTRETLNKLLVLLESTQGDKFAAHIYQLRKEYRRACEIAGKSGKQIERCGHCFFHLGLFGESPLVTLADRHSSAHQRSASAVRTARS